MTTPREAAKLRRPVIKNSRLIMRTTIHARMCSSGNSTKPTSAAAISILSTRGSRKVPITVTVPVSRAILPSYQSVRLATTKITSDARRVQKLSKNMNTMNPGTRARRKRVSLLATVTPPPPGQRRSDPTLEVVGSLRRNADLIGVAVGACRDVDRLVVPEDRKRADIADLKLEGAGSGPFLHRPRRKDAFKKELISG